MLPTAEEELEAVVPYLKRCSDRAAHALLDNLSHQLGLLGSGVLQHSLSRMPGLAKLGYRTALVGDHLFLYYIDDEDLVIARFFRRRQDYVALAKSRELEAGSADGRA